MPGSIQSIERAAAVLKTLGSAGRPLELFEIAQALGLAKPTTYGIVRTLKEVGFVHQDRSTSSYSLGDGLRDLGHGGLDANDLRSHATNWADALAARTRLEVHIGMPVENGALVIHHVFRPDGSSQRLRVGEVHPFHATALGKVSLAFAAGVAGGAPALERYTRRTVTSRIRFEALLHRVREDGFASDHGEYQPDHGSVAAPLRGFGGLGVGAVAVVGPVDRVFEATGRPLAGIVEQTRQVARAITRAIGLPR